MTRRSRRRDFNSQTAFFLLTTSNRKFSGHPSGRKEKGNLKLKWREIELQMLAMTRIFYIFKYT